MLHIELHEVTCTRRHAGPEGTTAHLSVVFRQHGYGGSTHHDHHTEVFVAWLRGRFSWQLCAAAAPWPLGEWVRRHPEQWRAALTRAVFPATVQGEEVRCAG